MLPVSTYGGMPAALRWIFWVYFATHIPITILIDAQVRTVRSCSRRRVREFIQSLHTMCTTTTKQRKQVAFPDIHPPALKELLAVRGHTRWK